MHWESHQFEIPKLPSGRWYVVANTDMPKGSDIFAAGEEYILDGQTNFMVGSRSVVVLMAK
jgi:glycogen operon protein